MVALPVLGELHDPGAKVRVLARIERLLTEDTVEADPEIARAAPSAPVGCADDPAHDTQHLAVKRRSVHGILQARVGAGVGRGAFST